MAPLGLLTEGEKGEIVEIRPATGRCGCGTDRDGRLCHMEDLGLRTGRIVEMLTNDGRGAILVRSDESRIALGRGMAMKIMVRRIEQ